MRTLFTLILAITTGISARGQSIPLPYTTGFDNPAQQAGWQEFRTGSLHTLHWEYQNTPSSTAPNSLFHDYPVGGTIQNLVTDWFVSPAMNMSGYGLVSLRLYGFTMGTQNSADYFGVWATDGSPDPADGDFIEIADLTEFSISPASAWNDTSDILIPFVGNNVYVALVYKANNNWYTVNVDDITIALENPVGVNELANTPSMDIFPNPSSGSFTVHTEPGFETGSFRLYDMLGKAVHQEMISGTTMVNDLSLPAGLYIYSIEDQTGSKRGGKLVIR